VTQSTSNPTRAIGLAVSRFPVSLLFCAALAASGSPVPQQISGEPASCPVGPGTAAPSAPNYCTDLVPTPDLQQVTGVLALRSGATPFGAAVTRDGRPEYRLAITIDGLPAPSTLGPYTAYVAWASTLSMDSVVKLGSVRNGETLLGEITAAQFRVVISAESAATVVARSGRLVLRGTSPSSRLLAHRDVTQLFGVGRRMVSGAAASTAGSDTMPMRGQPAKESMTWTMPPMEISAQMMPAMSGIEPTVRPWRAASGVDPLTLPLARPHEVLQLKSGDSVSLTASLVRRSIGGRTFTAYAYNGEIPGPVLVVPQGASIVVRFRNATDLPTTVHWHGVRLDNASDGADGLTQEAIAPDSVFTYHVRFPDAGVFWYHAHHREDIAQPLGLYGNILVTPAARDPENPVPFNREEVLTVGDLLVDSSGPAAWGDEEPTHALMGRFGNVMLVNGEWRPRWTVRRGEVVRFYLTNVSTARPYNLSFGVARVKVIGSDGGRFEHEAWASSVVIAPAERYVVDVRFAVPGNVALTNRVEALSHMTGALFPEVDTLATFHVSTESATSDRAASFEELHADHAAIREIASYRRYFSQPVAHQLWLQMRLHDLPLPIAGMLNGLSVPVDWNDGMGMLNWALTPHEVTWTLHDPASGAENMDIDWHFRRGDVAKVRISNDAAMPHAMAHAIHLHGQRFLVLERNGVPTRNLAWKDTVLVPAGETVDLLLDLADPGRWLLHCHIAEHMESRMMMTLTVDPRTT